jgi:2-oxoglutarate ferredoxin oxidoreductase subunit alpha
MDILPRVLNLGKFPDMDELPDISPKFADDPEKFAPYARDPETLARMWAIPGMQGMEHRIGGLEKDSLSGAVSHNPENHQLMVETRQKKIERIANDIPKAKIMGNEDADLLVIGWGSSYGAIKSAVDQKNSEGARVAYVHLKHLNPLPSNLGEIIEKYDTILVPEMNLGQLLRTILHSKFFKPLLGLNKVQGLPFRTLDMKSKIEEIFSQKEVLK